MLEGAVSWPVLVDFFFSTERRVAFFLNVLILGLTGFATTVALWVRLRKMRLEKRALDEIRNLSSPSREDVEEALEGSRSLLEARVHDLRTFKEARQPVDAGALTGLSTAALRRQLAPAKGIGRSLIILGLFGTLWGLGIAVTQLALSLDRGMDVTALAEAIPQTLGGMQTAFSTTLLGVGGSLVVTVFVGIARRGQDHVLQRMERAIAMRLIPLYDTSEAGLLAEVAVSLDDVQEKLASDLNEVVGQVRIQGEALRNELQVKFDSIEDAFEKRATELIETTGQALRATLEIVGERNEGEPSLAEYVRSVRTITTNLDEAVQSAAGLIPTLEQRMLAAIEAHRTGLEEAITAHNELMKSLALRQIEAADALIQATREDRTQSESLEATLADLSDALHAAGESWRRTDEMVERVGRSCYEAIHEGLRSFVDELDKERVDTSEERERIARSLAEFERVLSTHLERMQTERDGSLRMATELVEAVRDAVEGGIGEVGAELRGQGDEVGKQMLAAIEELSRELRELLPPERRFERRHQRLGPDPGPYSSSPRPGAAPVDGSERLDPLDD